VFIDFCGDKLEVVDENTGEIKKVEVFVAILGCSQLTYVWAVYTQSKEDLIEGCQKAFEYFGGVPRGVVPDNLKAAVTKSSKCAPIINESFEAFADHYGTVILPARAYRPRDKSLVEGLSNWYTNASIPKSKQVYIPLLGALIKQSI
jgi:transposase